MTMTTNNPEITSDIDDFECSPAVVMLFASLVAYGHYPIATAESIARAKFLIDGVLTAAFEHGFPNCDIARTKMARGPDDNDLIEILEAVCAAAGVDAFNDVFSRAGTT